MFAHYNASWFFLTTWLPWLPKYHLGVIIFLTSPSYIQKEEYTLLVLIPFVAYSNAFCSRRVQSVSQFKEHLNNEWLEKVKTPVLRMVLKHNNLRLSFNNFQRKLLELQDKSSTLRINFLPQKKDEESWNFVLHVRILWCRTPTLLHLYLLVIDGKIMVASHDCNILYVARVAPESKSLYKFGKARIFHSLISFLSEHLKSAWTLGDCQGK